MAPFYEFSLRAEKLKSDNLALEAKVLTLREKIADRHFTKQQEQDISARLGRFRGQHFVIFPHSEVDSEAGQFSKVVAVLLTSSAIGWKRDDDAAKMRWWPDSGLFIGEPKGATKAVADASDALVLALSTNGVRTKKHNPYPADDREGVIPIIVGSKPTP
jgi:hypothetical protein